MFILFWTRPVQLVFLTFFNKLINVDYEFFILSCTAHEICPELEDRMASAGGFVHARLCVRSDSDLSNSCSNQLLICRIMSNVVKTMS